MSYMFTFVCYMQVVSLGLASLMLWDTTVVYIPKSISGPFKRALAFPHGRSVSSLGGVAIFPWLLLCDKASNALAKAWFPPLPVAVAVSTAGSCLDKDAAGLAGAAGEDEDS